MNAMQNLADYEFHCFPVRAFPQVAHTVLESLIDLYPVSAARSNVQGLVD